MAMEISGGILHPVSHFSGKGVKQQPGGGGSSSPSMRTSRVQVRRVCFPSGGFEDNGHAEYYDRSGKVRCERKKGKEKGVLLSSLKKKELKLLKGLTKEPSLFSEMGFEETQGKVISEAAELLMKQFEQMRAEEKELKRQRKEEKARLKAMEDSDSESSSSSSSSSSESDCDEVINVRSFRSKSIDQSCVAQTHQIAGEEVAHPTMPGSADAMQIAPYNSIPAISSLITSSQSCDLAKLDKTLTASTKRIEVCMGGKCKKSGAVELLEEFERVVGVEGSVIGCKCMGKCKDGPNVRVSSCTSDKDITVAAVDKSAKRSSNLPLCIGVGLEDVGLIVTKFLEGDGDDANLAAATSM